MKDENSLKFEIAFSTPQEAFVASTCILIVLGAYLAGAGQLWFWNFAKLLSTEIIITAICYAKLLRKKLPNS